MYRITLSLTSILQINLKDEPGNTNVRNVINVCVTDGSK